MDFFERLREKARHITLGQIASYPNEDVFNAGINATIEALKEMMVGEVMFGEMPLLMSYEEPGTDGEEVVVMVFRDE